FPLLAAIMEIQLQQFAEQVRSLRFGCLTQILLDTGSLPGQPGRLEAVADFIHVSGRRRRPRAVVRLGGWAHGVTSFAQASRINRSFRSTVAGARPSWAAISSLGSPSTALTGSAGLIMGASGQGQAAGVSTGSCARTCGPA